MSALSLLGELTLEMFDCLGSPLSESVVGSCVILTHCKLLILGILHTASRLCFSSQMGHFLHDLTAHQSSCHGLRALKHTNAN